MVHSYVPRSLPELRIDPAATYKIRCKIKYKSNLEMKRYIHTNCNQMYTITVWSDMQKWEFAHPQTILSLEMRYARLIIMCI